MGQGGGMKGIVAYDSVNGNTKLIAEAMAEQLKVDGHDVEIVFIKDSVPSPMGDFMFVGSPTRGMKMTGRSSCSIPSDRCPRTTRSGRTS
jgi:flavodoxin